MARLKLWRYTILSFDGTKKIGLHFRDDKSIRL